MSEAITATFENSYDCAVEATQATVHFREKKNLKRVYRTQRLIFLGLAIFGLFKVNVELFDLQTRPMIFVVFLGSILTILAISYAHLPFQKQAYDRFRATRFGRKATVTLTAKGFELRTENSVWFTGWGDVLEVFKARHKAKIQAEKDGPIIVTLTPEGFQAGSTFGHFFVNRQSMEQVHKLALGFAVVWDNVAFAIPQTAYPNGLTTDDILARIKTWRGTNT